MKNRQNVWEYSHQMPRWVVCMEGVASRVEWNGRNCKKKKQLVEKKKKWTNTSGNITSIWNYHKKYSAWMCAVCFVVLSLCQFSKIFHLTKPKNWVNFDLQFIESSMDHYTYRCINLSSNQEEANGYKPKTGFDFGFLDIV